MTNLSVNVNKVATLRNTRPHLGIPSVVRIATLALEAGAHGITVHPRPDERHIKPHDVDDIAHLLKQNPHAEYNIEGNPFHNFMPHIRRVKPHQATLVPDDLAQSTSDHGWDLRKDATRLKPIVAELKSLGVRVSLFMDPDPAQMPLAKELGADRIELYTEPYATAFARGDKTGAAAPYATAAQAAHAAGLAVNAGHDLNLHNLAPFLRAVPHVVEVSIGHALVADALELGIRQAVEAYLKQCRAGGGA